MTNQTKREATCSVCKGKIIVQTHRPRMCALCSFRFRRASPHYEKTERARIAKALKAETRLNQTLT
jgi:hypothetical protein